MVREVQSGDNLWNIAKEEYRLNQSSDIAKTVKEIQGSNKITDANKINTGQVLDLPKNAGGYTRVDAIDENELVADFVEWAETDNKEANEKELKALNNKLSKALKDKRAGKISDEEYQKIRQEVNEAKQKVGSFDMKSADDFSKQIMNVLDKDGNGEVTFAEFKAAAIRRLTKEEAASAETLKSINDKFALVDFDENEVLTIDEIKDLLTFMDIQDKSKDGSITKTAYSNISSPDNTKSVQQSVNSILRSKRK